MPAAERIVANAVWPRQGGIPVHSPYQYGDWVRLHGYGGAMPGPTQWGWRGYVSGGFGSTILCGLTDDGRPWSEYWGHLQPDRCDPRDTDGGRCLCCPYARRPRPDRVQLRLFELNHPGPITRGDLIWWRKQYRLPIHDLWGDGFHRALRRDHLPSTRRRPTSTGKGPPT